VSWAFVMMVAVINRFVPIHRLLYNNHFALFYYYVFVFVLFTLHLYFTD